MVSFRTDIGTTSPNTVPCEDSLESEIIIVGAGFGGIYLLYKLRQLGFKCKIFEAGKDLGGVWYWNCYPGARGDSGVPIYEYSMPEVWKDWTWTEKYPGREELRRYFEHVDKVLDIKKDVIFEARVTAASFDRNDSKWVIKTQDGRTTRAKYFLVATGYASKAYFPNWKGLNDFQGEIHHSSFWPENGINVTGKRVAVIGTGSTGVQIAQETSRTAKSVTVFQRTPNIALPMCQQQLSKEEQDNRKDTYPDSFKERMTTFTGLNFDFVPRNTFDDLPKEREKFFQELYDAGGFRFWLATYKDVLFDEKANREAYAFWVKKTRERISDPIKRDILAPLEPPHMFGTKRPSLEQDYFEQMDKPENEVVDISKTPVREVTKTGIITEDGKFREFDVIALATGFDSVTGPMKNMGLKGVDGVDLSEKWKTGTWSFLGMAIAGYPNMFYLYGAQGPTAFGNGPTMAECQGNWIADAITKARDEGINYLEATKEAEEEWRRKVIAINDATLFPGTSSWYMGANIPGKPREPLNYLGGLPLYQKECRDVLNNDFAGFTKA